MRFFLTTALSTIFAGQLLASDTAFLVANGSYAKGRDIPAAAELLYAETVLEAAGFKVASIENGNIEEMREALAGFAQGADGTGRIVIAATGHFARSGSDAWMLGVDANKPALGTSAGINVETLIEIASRAPGQGVVLLGTEDARFELGAGLERGIHFDNVPQGVIVITGPTDDVADFAKEELVVKGQSLAVALQAWPSLTGSGFMAPLVPFLAGDGQPKAAQVDPNSEERAFWTATQNIGTENAYRGYLSRYSDGLFAKDAKSEIARIEAEPGLRAQAEEASLKLSRNERREIQRALSLIGFNPKGIDGIFGRGSRAAIASFQEANGALRTGFITRSQIEALSSQAEIRALELEREAEARKLELERQDRRYWNATGALGDEPGLRAYLERYPDGLFADIAIARLEPYDAERRAQAQAADRGAWDMAEASGSIDGFRNYIAGYPQGAFVELANEHIVALQQAERNAGALAIAQHNEQLLGLNTAGRQLVETRLAKAGLEPGAVDGTFDDSTRRAIRRYQEARNIRKPATSIKRPWCG